MGPGLQFINRILGNRESDKSHIPRGGRSQWLVATLACSLRAEFQNPKSFLCADLSAVGLCEAQLAYSRPSWFSSEGTDVRGRSCSSLVPRCQWLCGSK